MFLAPIPPFFLVSHQLLEEIDTNAFLRVHKNSAEGAVYSLSNNIIMCEKACVQSIVLPFVFKMSFDIIGHSIKDSHFLNPPRLDRITFYNKKTTFDYLLVKMLHHFPEVHSLTCDINYPALVYPIICLYKCSFFPMPCPHNLIYLLKTNNSHSMQE